LLEFIKEEKLLLFKLIDSEINLLISLKEGLLYFFTYSNPPSFFSLSSSPVIITPTSGINLSKLYPLGSILILSLSLFFYYYYH